MDSNDTGDAREKTEEAPSWLLNGLNALRTTRVEKAYPWAPLPPDHVMAQLTVDHLLAAHQHLLKVRYRSKLYGGKAARLLRRLLVKDDGSKEEAGGAPFIREVFWLTVLTFIKKPELAQSLKLKLLPKLAGKVEQLKPQHWQCRLTFCTRVFHWSLSDTYSDVNMLSLDLTVTFVNLASLREEFYGLLISFVSDMVLQLFWTIFPSSRREVSSPAAALIARHWHSLWHFSTFSLCLGIVIAIVIVGFLCCRWCGMSCGKI